MCKDCSCSNCENTEQFADVRNEAIRAAKERNPNAFAPKINSKNGRHLKGCHCKKSGCKKKFVLTGVLGASAMNNWFETIPVSIVLLSTLNP